MASSTWDDIKNGARKVGSQAKNLGVNTAKYGAITAAVGGGLLLLIGSGAVAGAFGKVKKIVTPVLKNVTDFKNFDNNAAAIAGRISAQWGITAKTSAPLYEGAVNVLSSSNFANRRPLEKPQDSTAATLTNLVSAIENRGGK